jgi:hypothetical protein
MSSRRRCDAAETQSEPEDMMAAKKTGTAAVVEKAEAVMKMSEYGTEQPTLMVAARTTDTACALRHNTALGLRAAAEVELALAAVADKAWTVNPPTWGDERRLPNGWSTTWEIHLEGVRGASAEVAMRALAKVAEILMASSRKGARR